MKLAMVPPLPPNGNPGPVPPDVLEPHPDVPVIMQPRTKLTVAEILDVLLIEARPVTITFMAHRFDVTRDAMQRRLRRLEIEGSVTQRVIPELGPDNQYTITDHGKRVWHATVGEDL